MEIMPDPYFDENEDELFAGLDDAEWLMSNPRGDNRITEEQMRDAK